MKQLYAIMIMMTLLLSSVSSWSQEVVSVDSILADTDSVTDPEWYVAPVIPASLRAPMRTSAAAASCNRVEAIQIFDIDSVLTEGTYYEYDDRGNVIITTVWAYALDGTMTGKSKNEYAFDAAGTQTMTAVYVWESAANDWKGTEKYEYIYQTVAGEKKMISNTSLAWLNGAWVADHRYTYGYDEAGHEISYFEYNRNTTTNELQPILGREQGWTNDLQTLEANYTAYANGQWTAGTKKEWAFDENGTQTMFTTFTMSNGAWVGSSKETWTYGGPTGQLTLHEKFGWANNDWSKTLKEETEYAGANIIRIENYTYSNGVTTGTKKEEYAFVDGKKVQTIVYAWKNSSWVGSSKETWTYGGPAGQLTLHEKYGWANNDWTKTLQEETEYAGANIIRIENYTYLNGVATGTKKEEYTYTGGKKTEFVTYAWLNGAWANATKETWAFTNGKQTLHEKFVGEGANWSKTLSEENEYSGANLIRVENYSYANCVTTGTKKETYAYSGSDKETIVYAWENDAWKESTKEVWGYTSGKQTLHETYEWYNDGWSVTLRELSGYDAAGNKNSIENYTGSEGVLIGTQKEEYTFNSAKEVIVTVKYKWSEGVWVEDSKNEAGYREGNTEYSEANYTWDSSAWVGTGNKTVTEYYAEDKVSAAWAYAWSTIANNWVYAARRICEYDGKERNIGDTTYTYVNAAWEYYKLQTHGFDSHDNDTLAVTATWNGTEWVPSVIYRGTFLYTESGDPLLVETYTGLEGAWTGQQKKVWAYNDFGSQTLYHVYEWKSKKWTNKEKREQSYDTNNHRLVDQSYLWRNNAWEGVDKYEYGYDDYGRQSMTANYIWMNNAWYGISKTENIMDQDGVLISSISYAWSNNKWEGTFKYDYVYDSYSRTIEKYISRYRNNQWSNYQHFVYTYDGIGAEKLSSYEYMWKSSNWRLISMFDNYYDTDHKLREEENGSWDSSTGDLVSYSDKHYFYSCDPHFYTIRFVNYDGEILSYITTQEGQTPSYPGVEPVREGNVEYIYTFAGWTPELAPVTSNVTYTATFTATKNTYTITWKNEDGTQIDQTTAEYGTMPTHEDASKANTAEYTYTFAGWTPAIASVTGDATYTATFTATKNKYLVTFKDEDGTVLQSEEVEYGVTPAVPTNPTKSNTAEYTYSFSGWDKAITSVTEAATYTATYTATKNSYTITWKNEDGSVIESETLEYGATPAHADINKESTAEYSYTFAGWTPQITTVTGDAVYTATFTATKKSYTITWKNDDGTTLKSEELEYGVMPTAPADPTKAATAEYTYTFAGWTPTIAAVTGDAEYTATYTATKNSYTITWKNEDGSVITSANVEYGLMPAEPTTPTKPADSENTYTFNGWTPQVAAVTGDATYTATFTATKNKYLVTFKDDDGTTLKSEELEYGVTPTAPANPTKAATAEWTYTFAGWDKEIISVAEATTYTATYTATKNSYTVTWLNSDNSPLAQTTVVYGETPVYIGEMPSRPSTAEYTYTFAGWTPQITAVTGDAEYTATFTATKNSYTVTWLNEDGSEIDHETLEYGAIPAHADMDKEATAEWTYTFAGWEPEVVAVVGDATYTAKFDSTKNNYTVTWLNEDGTEIEHETLEYGATPTHADIDKESTYDYTYTFTGWEPEITPVTGDATYTATFDSVANVHTIYYRITVTADDAVHGEAGFVFADAQSATLLTDSLVASGTWIELRATAADDWHFEQWSDGDTHPVRTIEVTSDAQYIASFAPNCGDYASLPVVILYDWLMMLDLRSIHAMGYTFGEEDITWYRVHGEPDRQGEGAGADDERLGTGSSFTIDQSLVNSGDYYATVDVSNSPAGVLCTGMMRSQIVHYTSSVAAAAPVLEPALVRPHQPQRVLLLNPDAPTTVRIYDISGHLLHTMAEDGAEWMSLQAEGVAGCYQVVVQNGDQRTVLRYIVVQ